VKNTGDPAQLIEVLQRGRQAYGFRAETLVPDIAFIGLVDDCIDAAQTALELLASSRPHRAYSMARVAFEASQRIVVLATSPDYIRLGTRAWLFYGRKDASIAGDSGDAIGTAGREIAKAWTAHYVSAPQVVAEELAFVRKLKGPDNFLGSDMATAVTESYQILAQEKGSSVPPDATELNRRVYRGFSRDAHACVRLEPKSLRVDSDGFVEVVERPRDPAEVAGAVNMGLATLLNETIGAVQHRLLQRRRTQADRLAQTLPKANRQLPEGFASDAGLVIAQRGLALAEMFFPDVPIQHILELPDGTLTVLLTNAPGSDGVAATFDFKGHARKSLLDIVREEFPDATSHTTGAIQGQIDLPRPIAVTVKAELGSRHDTGAGSFIPFIVTDVTRASLSQ